MWTVFSIFLLFPPSFFLLFFQHLLNAWMSARHHAKLEKTREMSNLSSRSSQSDTNYCCQCNEGCAPGGWGARLRKGEEGIGRVSLRREHLIALKDILVRQFLPILWQPWLLGFYLWDCWVSFSRSDWCLILCFKNHLLWVTTQLDVCFLVHTSITAHITLWSRYWSICLTFWLNCDVLQGKYSRFIFVLSLSKWCDWHIIVLNKVLLSEELFAYLQKEVEGLGPFWFRVKLFRMSFIVPSPVLYRKYLLSINAKYLMVLSVKYLK